MSETYFLEQQDGSRIAYSILEPHNTEDIKKTPLILIVGCKSVKEIFMDLKEVIIFDNRGMGESSVVSPYDPISMDLMAQDTIALVKHLGFKRFNLLGWSMGGRIAVHVASNIPSELKLEKLIIYPPKNIQELKDEIIKTFEKSFVDYMVQHPDVFDKYAEIQFTSNCPFEIFKRQWEAIKKAHIVSKLKVIKVPTLLIHGEADLVNSIKESEVFAREIANSKFIPIPKAGH
ncbi:24277_t:CDS:2, partial [Gigaspora margarita]